MKRFILSALAAIAWALPSYALITYHTNTVNLVLANVCDGTFNDFKFQVSGYDDQKFNFNYDQNINDVACSFRITKPIEGTIYLDVPVTSVTVSGTNVTFSIARTNIPPPGNYYGELLSYEASTTNYYRSLAQGKLPVTWSLYLNETNYFSRSTTNAGVGQVYVHPNWIDPPWLSSTSALGAVYVTIARHTVLSNWTDAINAKITNVLQYTNLYLTGYNNTTNVAQYTNLYLTAYNNTTNIAQYTNDYQTGYANSTNIMQYTNRYEMGYTNAIAATNDIANIKAVTGLYVTADNTISSQVSAAYKAAIAVVSGQLVTAYSAADNTLSGQLVSAYSARDTGVSNAFRAADIVISNALDARITALSVANMTNYLARTNGSETVEVLANVTNITATRTNATFYISNPSGGQIVALTIRVDGDYTSAGKIWVSGLTTLVSSRNFVSSCFSETTPANVPITCMPKAGDATLAEIAGLGTTAGTIYHIELR